jgi:hypothetical protein
MRARWRSVFERARLSRAMRLDLDCEPRRLDSLGIPFEFAQLVACSHLERQDRLLVVRMVCER